jgi:hypothetical protein
MLRKVKTNSLILLGHSNLDNEVDNFINDIAHDKTIDNGNSDSNGLNEELFGIAEEKSIRTGRVYRF